MMPLQSTTLDWSMSRGVPKEQHSRGCWCSCILHTHQRFWVCGSHVRDPVYFVASKPPNIMDPPLEGSMQSPICGTQTHRSYTGQHPHLQLSK